MANPNPTPFKKTGKDANPKGRPKAEWTWSGVLKEAVEKTIKDKEGNPVVIKEAVANSLIREAMKGNVNATREVFNRMDGMPAQPHEMGGNITVTFHDSLKQDE